MNKHGSITHKLPIHRSNFAHLAENRKRDLKAAEKVEETTDRSLTINNQPLSLLTPLSTVPPVPPKPKGR